MPDPQIQEPTDASSGSPRPPICGSDLHLYEVLGPFMHEGDILGHEPMGIVEEVGSAVTAHQARRPGRDPVQHLLRPLLHVRAAGCSPSARRRRSATQGKGAALFGYTQLYGSVPGGQAEYLRVPQAHYGPIKVAERAPDERYLFLSDILPTAWQAVEYADVPERRHAGRARARPGGPVRRPDRRAPRPPA